MLKEAAMFLKIQNIFIRFIVCTVFVLTATEVWLFEKLMHIIHIFLLIIG